MTSPTEGRVPTGTARFRLVVTEGAGAGHTRLEADAPVRMGRSHADSDLHLDDGAVSRQHAEILREGSGYRLRDCGSQNGTTCNGERVDEIGVVLRDGDVIGLGRTTVRFELLPTSPSSQPPPVVEPRDRGTGPPGPISDRVAGFELTDRLVDYGRWQTTIGWDPDSEHLIELLRVEYSTLAWFGRRAFLRAAEARRHLHHAALQTPVAVGTERGTAWVVLSHEPGIGAYDVLRDAAGDVPIALAAAMGRDVAEALAYLEDEVGPDLRVDVRDRTVRLLLDGRSVLCDCGLPMPLAPEDHEEPSIARYRAPEEDAGGAGGSRASIFATGVLLWELLAGDRVDPDQKTRLPPVDTMRLHVPRGLATIVQRATEVRPEDRFASASDLAASLDRACAETDPMAPAAVLAWLRERFPSQMAELEGESHE